jgi:hypothetical protein
VHLVGFILRINGKISTNVMSLKNPFFSMVISCMLCVNKVCSVQFSLSVDYPACFISKKKLLDSVQVDYGSLHIIVSEDLSYFPCHTKAVSTALKVSPLGNM